MSLLNSIGGPGSAWATASIKSKAFAKVDANDDKKVDQAELQAVFDAVAAKTGKPARDAEAVIARIDKDGDGAVTRLEVRAHLRELRAAGSTVEMAKRAADSTGS
jgi:Ca2+-binding EF-hand superfamily protein